MPKYKHVFQIFECVPNQVIPWDIWKAETNILKKLLPIALVAVVDKSLKTSLCSPLSASCQVF